LELAKIKLEKAILGGAFLPFLLGTVDKKREYDDTYLKINQWSSTSLFTSMVPGIRRTFC